LIPALFCLKTPRPVIAAHTLVSTLLLFQTPAPAEQASPPDQTTTSAERAAQAAERAAQAAERAAEANARMAEAIERLAQGITRTAPPAEPPATEQKPAEGTDKKKDAWDVTMGLGFIFLGGNTSTLTLNGLISAERKTEKWIYSAKAVGAYGRSRPPEVEGAEVEAQVVALNGSLQLRGDRRFTERLSGYLLVGAETDHVRSVELRGIGEAGASLIWWDSKRPDGGESSLRTDLAFRYARETRFQYYPTRMNLPDVDIGGPRFGAAFRHGLTKDIVFREELSVLPSLLEGSRLLVNNTTALSVRFTESLAIATNFLLQYDSEPAEGKVPFDTSLSVSVTVAF
jgi:hypothetical protein